MTSGDQKGKDLNYKIVSSRGSVIHNGCQEIFNLIVIQNFASYARFSNHSAQFLVFFSSYDLAWEFPLVHNYQIFKIFSGSQQTASRYRLFIEFNGECVV